MTEIPGPYSIGSGTWPGLSRLVEETGELSQVIGKLMGSGGNPDHYDGTDLRERLYEEIADVQAALQFVISKNSLDAGRIADRSVLKLQAYLRWHREGLAATGKGA